ncbi:hypothetical protein [Streptomyces griseus]|uniref:hypothetical protein n=1 Tax=Streptomyces griseus TaxID=1911 RepID=UPI003678A257
MLIFDRAHREDALAAIAEAGTNCLPVLIDGSGTTGDALLTYDGLLSEGTPDPIAVEVSEDAPAVLNFT